MLKIQETEDKFMYLQQQIIKCIIILLYFIEFIVIER